MLRISHPRAVLLAIALITASCSGSSDGSPESATSAAPSEATAGDAATTSLPPATVGSTDAPAVPADLTVTPSVHQVLLSEAEPGLAVDLVAGDGSVVSTGQVDDNGFLLFRGIEPGEYTARTASDPPATAAAKVLAVDDLPDQALYADQQIGAGFGYITTRDGTRLSATVSLPGPIEDGPYPTVVEYSGYAPSDPGDGTFAQIYTTLGFAYVGVNIRGSGCSGGAFGFFEPVQTTDGYDVIEALAAQPWVEFGHVGMVGISYPGISQLFVAQTQPPHLAAITPLSVLDDSYRSTLYPGGILNTGFAVDWSAERQKEAEAYGQSWTVEMAKGDPTCAENQLLRGQNQDILGQIRDNPFYDPAIGDSIAPATFVDRIEVPIFLAGAWQDEQTGGHFAVMLDRFTGTDKLFVNLMNGLHTESLVSLDTFARYVEFLDLYVAKRAPDLAAASVIAPILAGTITGVSGLALPERRSLGTDYATALAAFEAEPRIEVLFEEGAAEGQPAGSSLARFTAGFDTWPVTDTEQVWYLSGDTGVLGETPSGTGYEEYTADPGAVAATTLTPEDNEWAADVVYDWERNPAGTAAVWTTEPLAKDLVVIGSGWVDLLLGSSTGDTDVEATVSEIRSDGSEMYVQSGWLRASHRAESADSPSDGPPLYSQLEADAAPLGETADEMSPTRVELFPVAHVFRAGSRLRLTIDAPGGNRPVWAFETISDGETVRISTDAAKPSSLHLPIVEGVQAPVGYPACGSLRGQPCRPAA